MERMSASWICASPITSWPRLKNLGLGRPFLYQSTSRIARPCARAASRHRLSDVSPAGIEADRAETARQAQRLAAIDRQPLTGMDAVNYDTVAYVIEGWPGVTAASGICFIIACRSRSQA